MHLLLVEDDLDLGAELQRALHRFGFTSVWVRRAQDARSHMPAGTEAAFDCVLLDLGLPDEAGIALLHAWREQELAVPVIVVTARDAIASRVAGLDAGADDYLVKPVAPEELASRIRAVTRRASGHASTVWTVGRLQIDERAREVRHEGRPVPLSPKEFLILHELARRCGDVVAKHRLVRMLAAVNESNAIEFHIHNLRRKLGADTIETIRGVGYRLAS